MVFLDFPATMRTLVDVVDYKIPSLAKDKLGRKYIALFNRQMEDLRARAGDTIRERVQFVEKDLKFADAPAGFWS